MRRYLKLFVCMTATLTAAALAQTIDQPEPSKTSSPVAYVYVGGNLIDAFAASSTGKLTRVSVSPSLQPINNSMSVNKTYLLGSNLGGEDIYTFSIGSDGALRQVDEIDITKYHDCTTLGPLLVDHTGTTLYNQTLSNCDGTPDIESFKIEGNGELRFLGSAKNEFSAVEASNLSPLTLLGTDKYAYQTGCNFEGKDLSSLTVQYKRESNGLLTVIGSSSESPKTEKPGHVYCPFLLAGDPANHLAVAYSDFDKDSGEFVGPNALATYTADSHGNLTTKSTSANMPTTILGGILPNRGAMSISPSGKLLVLGGGAPPCGGACNAVSASPAGGSLGFQIFHFDGAEPITHYTEVLQSNYGFQQFSWDNDNHLYALTFDGQFLFVYTVTPTGITEAPGSPNTIPDWSGISGIVQGSMLVRSLK